MPETLATGLSDPGIALPRENIAGHIQRLNWLRERLNPGDRTLELGCGSGYMITLPLQLHGYDVVGIDLDEASVEYGRGLLRRCGLHEELLQVSDLADAVGGLDAIIASEVLEHLSDEALQTVLRLSRAKLRRGGKLLVTVPNGYGWFEMEAFLWFRTGVDRLFRRRRLNRLLCGARHLYTRGYVDAGHLSTLADSPHRQRFTLRSIERTLERAGLEVEDRRGSVLIAGPFSHMAFTGIGPVMRLNCALGARFPRLAAGFYLSAVSR